MPACTKAGYEILPGVVYGEPVLNVPPYARAFLFSRYLLNDRVDARPSFASVVNSCGEENIVEMSDVAAHAERACGSGLA